MPWTGRLTDIAFTCPPLNEFLSNISTMGIIELRSVSVFDRGSDLDFLTGFKFFFKAAWSCQSLPCLSADLRVWLLFPFRVNIYGGRPSNSHPYQENQEKKNPDQLLWKKQKPKKCSLHRNKYRNTTCPKSSYPFYIVSYYINWVTISVVTF